MAKEVLGGNGDSSWKAPPKPGAPGPSLDLYLVHRQQSYIRESDQHCPIHDYRHLCAHHSLL